MLTDGEKTTIEKLLRSERDDALDALKTFDREREESLGDSMGELSTFRLHPADIGTEAMEREKQFLFASAEGRHLYEIDEALRRLYREPEKFGVCARCGEPIGFARLEVVPEATLCAECQKASES